MSSAPAASRFSAVCPLPTERASRPESRLGTDGQTLAGPDARCWGPGLQSLVPGRASPMTTLGGCEVRTCWPQPPQVRPRSRLFPAGVPGVPVPRKSCPLLFAPLRLLPLRASRPFQCPWSGGGASEWRALTCASASRALAGTQEGQDAPLLPGVLALIGLSEARTFIALMEVFFLQRFD